MAMDLKNVNISLDEFQRISSGWYNAGEVKLKNANTLDKVNNHVATWWYDNKDDISHAETVAIKEALVKALSQHGVEGEALNRARQKLGLQPMDPSDKSLLKRSVMPLTRQQIREILDENAETLNQSEGHERIRTQAELDARKGDRALEKSTAKRNEINASLASRDEIDKNIEAESKVRAEAQPNRQIDEDDDGLEPLNINQLTGYTDKNGELTDKF